MTILSEPPVASGAPESAVPAKKRNMGRIVVGWVTSTDHKVIGHLYLISTFVFFLFGGVMALIIRAELAQPGPELARVRLEQAFDHLRERLQQGIPSLLRHQPAQNIGRTARWIGHDNTTWLYRVTRPWRRLRVYRGNGQQPNHARTQYMSLTQF